MLLKVDLIEGFIDSGNVLWLDHFQEWFDQGDVSGSSHDLDAFVEVDLVTDELEKVVEKHWLFLEVEDH